MNEHKFSLRIAGNTLIPAWQTLVAKGYVVTHYFLQDHKGQLQGQWEAEKEGRLFSATSPEEVLGLIAVWEIRGDNWHIKPLERELYDQLIESAPIYDAHGNIIEES